MKSDQSGTSATGIPSSAGSRERRGAELPPAEQMFRAFASRDVSFDGVFFTGVKTTGIFCRPICHARKPKRENVEFFPTAHEALVHGYRPCRVCNPLSVTGVMPDWVVALISRVHAEPEVRVSDTDLRREGTDPVRLRRWFKTNLGMTFHDYSRSVRVGRALSAIARGDTATGAAFDAGYESLSGFGEAVRQIAGGSPSAAAAREPILLAPLATPLGTMVAGAVEGGLMILEFTDRRGMDGQMSVLTKRTKRTVVAGRTPVHEQLEDEIAEYFKGTRRSFEVSLEVPGTPFQLRVWEALRTIPYGQTRSYAEQAALVGRPEAVRAVASANGANRIAIIIPCHRVIGSDGRLTGYGGGLWRKQRLLDLEAGRVRF